MRSNRFLLSASVIAVLSMTTWAQTPSGKTTSGDISSGTTTSGTSGITPSGNSASGNTSGSSVSGNTSGSSASGNTMSGESSRGQSQVGTRRDSLSNDSATHGKGVTASDQTNNKGDVDITAKIRREIMGTKGMSVNAHNVKIVTIDGKVTLKGVVNSASEKETVGEIANRIASSANVTNLLQVK